jgi:hypothetical protein
MPSIRQNIYPDLLPDFRNLAVMARVLLAVNGLALAGTLFATPSLESAFERFVQTAAFVEPLLLAALALLSLISVGLLRLPYWAGCSAVIALVMLLTAAYHAAVRGIGTFELPCPAPGAPSSSPRFPPPSSWRTSSCMRRHSPLRSPRRACRRCRRAFARISCSTA